MRSTNLWIFLALAGLSLLMWAAMTTSPSPARKPPVATPPATFTDFISPDFCTAVVIHWSEVMKSPVVPAGRGTQGYHWLTAAGSKGDVKILDRFAPQQVRRMAVLFAPRPTNGTSAPYAVTMEFEEDIDSQKLLTESFPDFAIAWTEGKEYLRSSSAGQGGTPLAAYIAGPRMFLLALEPTLEKMLARKDGPPPLLDRLRRANLDNELVIDAAGDSMAMLFRSLDSAGSSGKAIAGMTAEAILPEMKSVSVHVNLRDATLLRATIYGAQKDSPEKLYAVFGMLQMLAPQQSQPAKTQSSSPEPPPKPRDLGAELLKGLKVTKNPDSVVIAIKRPDNLPELIK